MKHPQIVVYERDGRLAQVLRPTTQERSWALREPRQVETCLRELRGSEPTVLVLHIGAKLEQELAMLERTSWLLPDIRTVVVGDMENEPLSNLAWDLGASYVLFPPLPRDGLAGVVGQLMTAAIDTFRRASVASADEETADTTGKELDGPPPRLDGRHG